MPYFSLSSLYLAEQPEIELLPEAMKKSTVTNSPIIAVSADICFLPSYDSTLDLRPRGLTSRNALTVLVASRSHANCRNSTGEEVRSLSGGVPHERSEESVVYHMSTPNGTR